MAPPRLSCLSRPSYTRPFAAVRRACRSFCWPDVSRRGVCPRPPERDGTETPSFFVPLVERRERRGRKAQGVEFGSDDATLTQSIIIVFVFQPGRQKSKSMEKTDRSAGPGNEQGGAWAKSTRCTGVPPRRFGSVKAGDHTRRSPRGRE